MTIIFDYRLKTIIFILKKYESYLSINIGWAEYTYAQLCLADFDILLLKKKIYFCSMM